MPSSKETIPYSMETEEDRVPEPLRAETSPWLQLLPRGRGDYLLLNIRGEGGGRRGCRPAGGPRGGHPPPSPPPPPGRGETIGKKSSVCKMF